MPRLAKHMKHLEGGPYDGKTIYLSDDGSTTITFGVGKFYGRYAGGGNYDRLHWEPVERR